MERGVPGSRQALARRALAALDLTRLGDADTPEDIEALCAQAAAPVGAPAALCVHPEWIATCRARLDGGGLQRVAVASVVNFPDGAADAARAARETRRALAAGASEIDVVLPWRALLRGDPDAARDVLRATREACAGRARVKAILETGELRQPEAIRVACELAISAGADFVKTSTGKAALNATPEAARVMLEAVRAAGGRCGFKAAGGIRTLDDAAQYFRIADELLGPDWADPSRFRLGASALHAEIVHLLAG